MTDLAQPVLTNIKPSNNLINANLLGISQQRNFQGNIDLFLGLPYYRLEWLVILMQGHKFSQRPFTGCRCFGMKVYDMYMNFSFLKAKERVKFLSSTQRTFSAGSPSKVSYNYCITLSAGKSCPMFSRSSHLVCRRKFAWLGLSFVVWYAWGVHTTHTKPSVVTLQHLISVLNSMNMNILCMLKPRLYTCLEEI